MAGINIFRLFGEIGLDGVDTVRNDLEDVSNAGNEAEQSLAKSFNEMSTKAGELAGKMAIGLGAVATGLIAGVEATKEFRQDLGRLEAGYAGVGLSSETATNVFKEFYGILGEDDTAIEASNLLKELAKDEESLADWTDIAAGVYARFPDSIPIEAMIESANETVKVGQITGNLADAINWASASNEQWAEALSVNDGAMMAFEEAVNMGLSAEDAFNLALQQCNSETEREELLRSTMNSLYKDSAAEYNKTNKSVIANNKSQAELNLQLAEAMEKLEPMITKGKLFLAEVLNKAQPLITWLIDNAPTVGTVIAGVLGTLFALSLPAKIAALKVAIMGLNATMAANPIGLIILAVGALITIIALLIQNWDKVKEVAEQVWNYIVEIWQVAAQWFDENVIQPIAQFFTNLWTGIVEGVTSAWTFISEIFLTIAQWLYDNVILPIMNFFAPIVEFFVNIITNIFNFYKEILTVVIGLAQGLWNIIVRIFEVAAQWFYETVITPIANFFAQMWEGISNAAKLAWNFIAGVWSIVSSWFNDTIITPVSNFFTKMWEGLKTGASNAWEGIKSVFSPVAEFFGNIFSKAWEKVKSIFSTGGKIFSGIKEGITSSFTKVVNAIITGINKVVKIPFDFINGTLNTIRNISFLEISPFKGLWKYNPITVPQIPQLAEGGVLEEGQTGYLEGNGAEAVVPLHNNQKWISAVADDMNNAVGGASGSELNDKLDRVIDLLLSYFPQFAQMQMVTDTGALVGELVTPMDRALGELTARKGRGR